MKRLSSFFRDNVFLIAIACIVGYGVWRRFQATSGKDVSFKMQAAEKGADLKKPVDSINPKKRSETIAQQRQILSARLAISSRTFKPLLVGQNMQMTFRLEPRPRACKDGDIDLIRKVAGDKGKLLLTLEDDSEALVSIKKPDPRSLQSPYALPISLKPSDQTRIFKLTLCSDLGQKSCAKLQAFDFDHYSKKLGAGSVLKNPEQGLVFYSYSFGLIKGEIQLFDGTNLSNRASYEKFLKAVGGNDRQLSFIDETLAQQKKLGILPLTVDKHNIVLPLYFNDKSQCTLSMNGRRQ